VKAGTLHKEGDEGKEDDGQPGHRVAYEVMLL